MQYEAVGKTRTGWNRSLGVFSSQEQAQECANDVSMGEGTDTMVRPVGETRSEVVK